LDFDQHAYLAAHVDVGADNAFCRNAPFALFGAGQAGLAQDFNRLFFVTISIVECLLHSIIPAPVFSRRFLTIGARNLCHNVYLFINSQYQFTLEKTAQPLRYCRTAPSNFQQRISDEGCARDSLVNLVKPSLLRWLLLLLQPRVAAQLQPFLPER